eukprot:gene2681-13493_t
MATSVPPQQAVGEFLLNSLKADNLSACYVGTHAELMYLHAVGDLRQVKQINIDLSGG